MLQRYLMAIHFFKDYMVEIIFNNSYFRRSNFLEELFLVSVFFKVILFILLL